MRFYAVLCLALVVAACSSAPKGPVGPQDGAVWVDVDVTVPAPSCPPPCVVPDADMPPMPCLPAVPEEQTLGDPPPRCPPDPLPGPAVPNAPTCGASSDLAGLTLTSVSAGRDLLRSAGGPLAVTAFPAKPLLVVLGFGFAVVSLVLLWSWRRRVVPVLLLGVLLVLPGCVGFSENGLTFSPYASSDEVASLREHSDDMDAKIREDMDAVRAAGQEAYEEALAAGKDEVEALKAKWGAETEAAGRLASEAQEVAQKAREKAEGAGGLNLEEILGTLATVLAGVFGLNLYRNKTRKQDIAKVAPSAS